MKIKEDDVVQVVRGVEWGSLGVVMSIQWPSLNLWCRTPGSSEKLVVNADDVEVIGKAKIRPLKEGERPVPVPPISARGSGPPQSSPPAPQQADTGPAPINQPQPASEVAQAAHAPAVNQNAQAGGDSPEDPLMGPAVFHGPSASEAPRPSRHETLQDQAPRPSPLRRRR